MSLTKLNACIIQKDSRRQMEEMSLINFVVFIIKLSFSQIALKKHLLIALIKIILFYVDL